ncbi:MAG: hypothetical protein EOO51_09505 [Flavobacterium sp.]|nr:MAG: hypothetical protein EOO51_09505 [Flavobacterium sp.]
MRMKNFLLLITYFWIASATAQTFHFHKDGSADFIVHNVARKKANSLYSAAEKWINMNLDGQDDVYRSRMPGRNLSFAGTLHHAFQKQNSSYDAAYIIELHFKDGKYRVRYLHQALLSGTKRATITIGEALAEKPSKDNHWTSPKMQYEAAVNKLLTSLHRTIAH